MKPKRIDFFKKAKFTELIDLSRKHGNVELAKDILLDRKALDVLSEELSVLKELSEYENAFSNSFSNSKKAIEIMNDYKLFLLERVCFPKDNFL